MYTQSLFDAARSFAILLILSVLAGCAASTEITGSWKSPEVDEPAYKNLFLAALTKNLNAKQTVENEMTAQLQKQGVQVTESSVMFAPNFTDAQLNDKQAILREVQQNGNDAILTLSLIQEKTESRYVPGTAGYDPTIRFGYYGTFSGYYAYNYPMLYDPGYYTEDKTYFLESNLYDVKSGHLVWSAQSQSYDPANLDAFAEDFAKVTIKELEQEGLIQ